MSNYIVDAEVRAKNNYEKDAENKYKDWLEYKFNKICILERQILEINNEIGKSSIDDFYVKDTNDYGRS